MGLRGWLARATAMPPAPARHTFAADDPKPIDQAFADLYARGGTSVTRDAAMSVSAVQRGRNLLCAIATLPLEQVGPNNVRERSPLLEQIDPNVANVVTLALTIEDLMFDAVAWWRVLSRDHAGYPMTARRLTEGTVSPHPPGGQTSAQLPSGVDPTREGVVYVDGKPVSWRDIIRFDSPNPGLSRVGGRAVRRAIMLEQAANMYADNWTPLEYFTARDGLEPEHDEEIDEFLAEWKTARKDRAAAYVPWEYEYHGGNGTSPKELQLVELQKKATLDLANGMGVDPEELGVSTTSRTYSNAVDRRRDRINDVHSPFMLAITQRLSMGDVTRRGYRVLFTLDEYMRANPTERWAVYEKATTMGAMTIPEVRNAESWAPLPADSPSTEDAPPAPVPLRPVADDSVAAAGRHLHRFHNPDDRRHVTFAMDTMEGEGLHFAVDATKRVIAGLALPWNKVGQYYGMKIRFKPGSIEYSTVERVKHFKDHVTPVGKALELKNTRAGLFSKLSVGRGVTGDELLQLAEDGIYDGLSVGVRFSLNPDDGDITLARDGVYDVHRATLDEITTTPLPRFDDARVTTVAASRHTGGTMPCATCGHEHAPNVACATIPTPATVPATTPPAGEQTVTMSRVDLEQVVRGIMAGSVGPNPPADPGPATVNPTTLPASTSVTDPVSYRFDRRGNLMMGAHDFSTDLFNGYNGDTAALQRATEFARKHYERLMFDVATGDVNELNPVVNRPDMYVDQRQFRYPVWTAISKGGLGNITPFTFPKFNSASGLVGAHTEGVEPSSGTFTVTNQTITPTAVSGKAKITRETWDQGGNPQVSGLIWRKMEQGWWEALEARAVAALDAVTPTAIALTAGGGTTGQLLDSELTAAFAALQFVRGGFSMDNAFTQIDLYKALVAAKDDAGRRLYPAIGPQNASGQVSNRFGAIDVNGVIFNPAWALAASGAVVASSYLFDSESVHGWASTPQRLDFNIEVAHVYIGLWGYAATAISDLAGVREITYDPVA